MRHPRERNPWTGPLSRRDFLKRSAASAVALSSVGALLEACGSGTPPGGAAASTLPLARPDHPVRWPIQADNRPIKSGLEPEQNATLKIYNWEEYMYKKSLRDFEKQYSDSGVKVEISTFANMDEALTKIRSGQVDFDILVPTIDVLGKLVTREYLRPLNHSYLTNLDNVWVELRDPYYDRGARYTVPYVTYTTGVAWRTDLIDEDVAARDMPYDVFWDPQYKDKTEVLDDYRETIGMTLLRHGIFDLNTGSSKNLDLARRDLLDLSQATNPLVNVDDYIDLPEAKVSITEAWSGDMVNAQYYGPKGFDTSVLRYWAMPTHAPVNNDLLAILRAGKNPVLAHLFLDYLLEFKNAMTNFSWLGYQPPQTRVDADLLVKQQYIPENLRTAVVDESIWKTGTRELELSPAVDAAWHDVWSRFKAGA
ncbi:MAG: spermidine/putrescine ABC transporter substrate-binding protein [Actinomycetota bacterium]